MSVNPDVGGRRLLNFSPLTTSKVNSMVEDTQKMDSAQTRLPTPETDENLTGPRDTHGGLKIQDFDAVERNRKAQKNEVLGACRKPDTHARNKVCPLDVNDLVTDSRRGPKKNEANPSLPRTKNQVKTESRLHQSTVEMENLVSESPRTKKVKKQ